MKMHMNTTKSPVGKNLLLAGLVAGVITTGAHTVSADDGKLYAGSECVAYSGTARYSSAGAVYNSSATSDVSVVCPIVHDQLGGQNIASAVVTVIDTNNDSGARRVSCRLLAHLRDNGTYFGNWSTIRHSHNGDPVALNFGAIATLNAHHYYFRCAIPRRDANTNRASQIVSYRVNEQ